MTTTQEHYSLRWNNHQNHILRAFDSLLQTKTLVDVTLVCAEKSIRAHKVVLSACSPFFQRVFSETPCKHPVIVLKDFRGWVVQAIVDFMYRGEISVPQERLQTLIQAGESLQVRGLVDHPVAGGNSTPTPAASPDNEFDMMDSISPEPTEQLRTFDETSTQLINNNTNTKLLIPPHVFVDSTGNLQNPEICTSPMPRRKQARPRRRSGECAPQDLSSKPTTPVPSSVLSGNSCSNNNDRDTNLLNSSESSSPVKHEHTDIRHKDEERPPSAFDHDNDIENDDNENEIETSSQVSTNDGPENLCMKKFEKTNNNNNHESISNNNNITNNKKKINSNNNNNSSSNNKNNNNNNNNNSSSNKNNSNSNNNNRIVLSLKDIRHLNRVSSSSIHHRTSLPPPLPPTNQLLPNLPLSPPPSHPMNLNNHHSSTLGHSVNNLKLETDDGHMERESPFLEQMELQLAHHNLLHGGHLIDHGGSLNSKDFSSTSPMSLPPHFSHQDGHHSQSPLPFPSMPGVSALTLTPPHMFGLDSPLGLFPHGMDPGKLYSPLMEMSDPRGMHPETPPFLKKKSMNWSSLEWGITEGLPPHWSNVRGSRKMNRPKGQHSAPRGGPPRSWTNAELTEALQHVWNKKMTTSQASRIFGIPYNSLLMYVRGKYGKSLKLEQLRKDCISGPPIELLTMGISGSNNNNNNNNNKGSSHNQNKELKDLETNLPRSSSSEPDLLSSTNQMFNPFPPGFYPDFTSGFPGLPLSVLNLLPPDRHPQLSMAIDEDCKSDRSKQSIDDEYSQQQQQQQQQPLALNRDDRRELLQQNGQD